MAYYNGPDNSKAFSEFKADDSAHLKLLYCIDMLNEGGGTLMILMVLYF